MKDPKNALRSQVRVDKVLVGEFILGIVVNILGHVRIENLKGSGVRCTPTSPWNLAVLDSSQFVVLYPQIGLEDFRCGEEPENCCIAGCEAP